MNAALTLFLFALDRVRTVLLALSVIVFVKLAWMMATSIAG
jgi:hypothetical protein